MSTFYHLTRFVFPFPAGSGDVGRRPSAEKSAGSGRRSNNGLYDFGNVFDNDLVLDFHGDPTVFEHGDTVRAAGHQFFGAGIQGLLQPQGTEPFILLRFHPDASAAAAAAQALHAGFAQFEEFNPRHTFQHLAGFVEDLVVPAQIAGVVVGDLFLIGLADVEPAGLDQFEQILGNMDDLEVDHEIRIFVFKGMVAMRRGYENLLHTLVDKGFDVVLGQFDEQFFGTGLADAFTATAFLFTQYPEIHAGFVQNVGSGAGNFFHAWVEAGITARIIENFHIRGKCWDGHTVCPGAPFAPLTAQGIAFADQASPDAAQGFCRLGIDIVQVGHPSQGHAGFDLFDVSRAALGTSSAGGAEPQIFTVDLGQSERGLPDQFAHGKVSEPVPGANAVA
ncbi:hypothetical protein DESC_350080 [Desulfosarcina cetonica]|nr:hypothetical protein DESC_350080 [Desulfosarcina cetonica]